MENRLELCKCGHFKKDHIGYYEDETDNCLIFDCDCLTFEPEEVIESD